MQPGSGSPHRRQSEAVRLLRTSLDAVGRMAAEHNTERNNAEDNQTTQRNADRIAIPQTDHETAIAAGSHVSPKPAADASAVQSAHAAMNSQQVAHAAPVNADSMNPKSLFPSDHPPVPESAMLRNASTDEELSTASTASDSGELANADSPGINAILQEVKRSLGRRSFEQCFSKNARLQIQGDCVEVLTGNAFLHKWVQKEFGSHIETAVQRVCGASTPVRFAIRQGQALPLDSADDQTDEVDKPRDTPLRETANAKSDKRGRNDSLKAKSASGSSIRFAVATNTQQLNEDAGEALTFEASTDRSESRDEATRVASPVAADAESREGRRLASLQDFVWDDKSLLGRSALEEILSAPGQQYSPLYLQGDVGVGKSHLLEGCYRELRQRYPHFRVLLLSAETFARQYTAALNDRTTARFRMGLRNVDALLVDDIDFFVGKSGIAKEFLQAIKSLETRRRQVVLTSDRHPRMLTGLNEELISRCVGGLVVKLPNATLDVRRTIVQQLVDRAGLKLAATAVEWLANRLNHARELQGAINTLAAQSLRLGRRLSLATVREELADFDRDCTRVVTLKDIDAAICRFFQISGNDLRSSVRKRTVSQPRMLAMFLARKHTGAAYTEIGEYFGGRNHSTVISAQRKVQGWLKSGGAVQVARQGWQVDQVICTLEKQLRTA